MLFDLRGRGRRRTVQVIYAGLALLIGAGLVFFGVGAGVGGGGLLNSLTGNEGAGSASFSAQIEKDKKLTQKQPNNVHAWEQLTLAQLHEAGGEAYVTSAGQLTSKGRALFTQIGQSWQRYSALNPKNPNPQLALQMVRVFGEEGLNRPTEVVNLLQVVIAAKQDSTAQYRSTLYGELAGYAYQAGNASTGDLAAAKAVSLAPAAQRKRLARELGEIKKHPHGQEFTTTTNGKKFNVKPGPNGTYTGTAAAPATTQPGGLTSSNKTTTK